MTLFQWFFMELSVLPFNILDMLDHLLPNNSYNKYNSHSSYSDQDYLLIDGSR